MPRYRNSRNGLLNALDSTPVAKEIRIEPVITLLLRSNCSYLPSRHSWILRAIISPGRTLRKPLMQLASRLHFSLVHSILAGLQVHLQLQFRGCWACWWKVVQTMSTSAFLKPRVLEAPSLFVFYCRYPNHSKVMQE